MRITKGQLRRIVREEAACLREGRGDEGGYNQHKINRNSPEAHPDVGDEDQITSATAHRILNLAQEACELAAENGIDYGDPYEATMKQLHDLLDSITV